MATAFVDELWVPSGQARASSNWPIPLVGPNQIRMADAKCQCQLVNRNDGRIPASLVQSADILLTEAGNLGKLLLHQTLLLSDPHHIPSDQLAMPMRPSLP